MDFQLGFSKCAHTKVHGNGSSAPYLQSSNACGSLPSKSQYPYLAGKVQMRSSTLLKNYTSKFEKVSILLSLLNGTLNLEPSSLWSFICSTPGNL